MFLEMLNEEQKELFLHLAVKAAYANEILEEAEKDMLIAFAKEMNIKPVLSSDKDLEVMLEKLKLICGGIERKIILFELVGVMYSDNVCDNSETAFLEEIAKAFNIDNSVLTKMCEHVKDYIQLYRNIFDTVIK